MSTAQSGCPERAQADERKSAAVARVHALVPGYSRPVRSFALARAILRSPAMVQDIQLTASIPSDGPDRVPVVFLDGEVHRSRRANLARFFSPKAITDHHRAVMDATTQGLMAELKRTGRGQIDLMSMQLACNVAANVVGLTDSDQEAMARRIRLAFEASVLDRIPGLGKLLRKMQTLYKFVSFFWLDVKPAIRARRAQPRGDIISHLLEQDYSEKSILIECLTYATAGMLTTREFIVMVAWYLFERDDLRQRFLEGGEDVQFAILEEILRLEPVAGLLYRRAEQDLTGPDGEEIRRGDRFTLDIRAVNADEAAVGACPFQFGTQREKPVGAAFSFGDGAHRCPGAQIALHETRVFIDALFRVPGIRLERPPQVGWCDPIGGYELHGAIVSCPPGSP